MAQDYFFPERFEDSADLLKRRSLAKRGRYSLVCLRLGKRTIEPITATHNDCLVGNVVFAIQKWSFAASGLNG
jgi:hypothetical protein